MERTLRAVVESIPETIITQDRVTDRFSTANLWWSY